MEARRSKGVRGFTLLEIMIAMAILAVSLLALYSAVGNSLRASAMAEDTDQATHLARQKMAEVMMSLEEDLSRGAFPDEKEEHGTFEKPFERFQWSYALRKVELPVMKTPQGSEPTGSQGQGGQGGGSPPGGSTTPGLEAQAGNLAQIVSKKISESVRELKLTVSWGEEEREEDREKVVVTTHLAKLK